MEKATDETQYSAENVYTPEANDERVKKGKGKLLMSSSLLELHNRRQQALTAFEHWEENQQVRTPSTEEIFSAIGTLYDLLPEQDRHRSVDLSFAGISIMQDAFRHLGISR